MVTIKERVLKVMTGDLYGFSDEELNEIMENIRRELRSRE